MPWSATAPRRPRSSSINYRQSAAAPLSLAQWVEGRIQPLRNIDPDEQQRRVIAWVRELDRWERFTLLKMLTGELRLGVSQTLVVRALGRAAALPPAIMAARLMGDWVPTAGWYRGRDGRGRDRRRSLAPVAVFSGIANRRLAGRCRSIAGVAGRSRRLAG